MWKPNKSFPLQIAFGYNLYKSNRKQTNTTAQPLHGYQEFALRFSYLCSNYIILHSISSAPSLLAFRTSKISKEASIFQNQILQRANMRWLRNRISLIKITFYILYSMYACIMDFKSPALPWYVFLWASLTFSLNSSTINWLHSLVWRGYSFLNDYLFLYPFKIKISLNVLVQRNDRGKKGSKDWRKGHPGTASPRDLSSLQTPNPTVAVAKRTLMPGTWCSCSLGVSASPWPMQMQMLGANHQTKLWHSGGQLAEGLKEQRGITIP